MLVNAGTISLAGREVITRSGSLLNLDGGYIHYLGGYLETTRLVAANGAVFDIENAEPNLTYIGFAGKFIESEPRWNSTSVYYNSLLAGHGAVYESGYIHGGNAG